VKLGTANSVAAVPTRAPQFLIDKAQKNSVSVTMDLEPGVTAPVSKGQRLGTLTVRCEDRVLEQIPLVAEGAVPKVTWGQMFIRVLKQIAMGR
jgi:D-alanyl-D-alanine carboxypeptidase (penicillin-binding protein 5/6)